ncbi:hypothetical protein [Alistipes indistinctus]|uniref:Uncharacterized protein n=1 Tax=Alistipes indistinctus YIT 12060 TaxID=742725 RepID=G5H941_9BACT|nr:hypothetical protein [Alistipes indistinctus]EHB92078.1 hypothetical protein HMPREF9450_02127 [Alistipes indistinctus YIT 12060]UWN59490.1 hypothetical protein NQ495_00615 [Alistipes indistinctus YIT 12060]
MKKIINYFRQKRDARFLKRVQRALATGANLRINGELSVAGNTKAFDNVKTTEWITRPIPPATSILQPKINQQ